jgi:hypothetical protein
MEIKILPEGYLLAAYLGFFLALGACLGMVAFEVVRRGLQTVFVVLTAATAALGSRMTSKPKPFRKDGGK